MGIEKQRKTAPKTPQKSSPLRVANSIELDEVRKVETNYSAYNE
jgi:hypothetical protein